MKMRAIIVEDEEPARLGLQQMLKNFPEIQVVAEAVDGVEALEKISQFKPDVIFLDIQIPELNGFEVLRALKTKVMPIIIFTTAYDQYAIQAFEVNAVDYLLKPFDEQRLAKSIVRAKRLLKQKSSLRQKISHLVDSFDQITQTKLNKIPLYKGERIFLIDTNQIVWIELESGIVKMKVNEEVYNSHLTLPEFERKLNPKLFLRVNRTTIVNLSRIKEVIPWFNRSYRLIMADKAKSEVDVSRRRAKRLKEIFEI